MKSYDCTPLHYASENGLTELTNSLIKAGAVVNTKNA